METATHVFFYGHTPKPHGYHVFSQWFMSEFVDEHNQKYVCTEQYMMAQKAMLFDDINTYKLIIAETKPTQMKKLGRQIYPFNEDIWNQNKYQIVLKGNYYKFDQNPELKKTLMRTGSKIIVEASPYDKIWGIGMGASEASKISDKDWPGQNLLGKVLVDVREEFETNT